MDVIGTHIIAQASVIYEQKLPDELIKLLCEEVEKLTPEDYEPAEIGNPIESENDSSIRNSKVSWWFEDHWACSVLSHYFNKANREVWEYDLNHLDRIQITSYDAKNFYTWHCDYGVSFDERYTRKLSCSLVLTDESEYTGGELELIGYDGKKIIAPTEKGNMIIFDSRVPHRVKKLQSGKRISLVAWMLGPKLR